VAGYPMQEIEVAGEIDEQGQLLLLQPLNLGKHTKVRVRITLLEDDFEEEADSKEQILADFKESLRQAQAGQTFPISELWDEIDV
jgi:predicted DNA-binding antitoxin AbrB/MazE fold protein